MDDQVYAKALAGVLKGLACSGDDDAIYVVRGEGLQAQLFVAQAAAIDLIDDLMNKESKDCPVSARLTEADRASCYKSSSGSRQRNRAASSRGTRPNDAAIQSRL